MARILESAPRPSCSARPQARFPGRLHRIERFFVRHRERLVWVHGVMFVGFIAIVLLPAALPEPGAGLLSGWTPLANYLLWGLWFPLVLLSVIFTGRSWCGLFCPMGAASEWANRRGLQRAIPGWLRWPGTPVVAFILVTVLGQTVGVRDHPEAIAEVFGGTLLAAVGIGFVYGRNKRAWCRHLCPIGLLLGVFSRLGAVQFMPKRPLPGGDRYSERGICPTLIDIPRKQESRHCIECFRCVVPEAKGGLYLRLRKPGQELAQIRDHHPNAAELAFLFLGTGTALGAFLWLVLPVYQSLRQGLGEWLIGRGQYWIGESGPWWLMSVHPERREVFNWLDFISISGFILVSAMALALLLSVATALGAWAAGRMGGDRDGRTRFLELGYQYAPVAMVSLVLGLGGALFEPLRGSGLHAPAQAALLLAGYAWSLWLGWLILARQGLSVASRLLALQPGLFGSSAIALAWWVALF